MTIGGWIIMIVSVGFVTGFLGWCIYRVVREPEAPKKLHVQGEIDTHDQD
ncbi:MAG TPA: hypothetical protein VL486_13105 [Verrucomicrobiae bacterium]|nr:hypothetical protein [Verrucomicrobiae bacterium]